MKFVMSGRRMEFVVFYTTWKLMFVSLVGCSDMACHIDGFKLAMSTSYST